MAKREARILLCAVCVFLLGLCGAAFTGCRSLSFASDKSSAQTAPVANVPPQKPPQRSYGATLAAVKTRRAELAERYNHTAKASDQAAVLNEARSALAQAVGADITPYWMGTEWDFYGTTETPQQGKIACGYFVTTVLRDAGLRVQRVSLAQQASAYIIGSLIARQFVTSYSNLALDKFVAAVRAQGAGLYIVGLDFHVGFIWHDGAEVWFIHSSYVAPRSVVREVAQDSVVLGGSKLRVLGNLTADDMLLRKWFAQEPFPTRTR